MRRRTPSAAALYVLREELGRIIDAGHGEDVTAALEMALVAAEAAETLAQHGQAMELTVRAPGKPGNMWAGRNAKATDRPSCLIVRLTWDDAPDVVESHRFEGVIDG